MPKEIHTRAEIYLNHLHYNLRQIEKRVHPASVMAVVKADAYGHGAVPVSRYLIEAGVRHFAVARVQEALELRDAGIDRPILIFGSLFQDEIETAIAHDVQITITDASDLDLLCRATRRMGKMAMVHLNIDSGMGRVGILADRAMPIVRKIADDEYLVLEGVYSHFATSDTKDKTYAYQQLERFRDLIDQIHKQNIMVPNIHVANGGAILDMPESYQLPFTMVRAGIILYGQYPSLETSESINLKQVMALKTEVCMTRRLPAGSSISYGCRYRTRKESTIAVLPIGYADGIQRSFSNRARVQIRGQLYPMVGTVTMDQIMVDVGDEPVAIGDSVLIWGDSPQPGIVASKLAETVGTISYELCCAVSKRVPRKYIRE